MEAAWAMECRLTPEAAEFVRFCYRRRKVGWPEIYDEMCAVASRGLFRGWGPDELAQEGIGFGLFELPALAALVSRIVIEEQPERNARGRARSGTDPRSGTEPRSGTDLRLVTEPDSSPAPLVAANATSRAIEAEPPREARHEPPAEERHRPGLQVRLAPLAS